MAFELILFYWWNLFSCCISVNFICDYIESIFVIFIRVFYCFDSLFCFLFFFRCSCGHVGRCSVLSIHEGTLQNTVQHNKIYYNQIYYKIKTREWCKLFARANTYLKPLNFLKYFSNNPVFRGFWCKFFFAQTL